MRDTFEATYGSVAGKNHASFGKNNQDSCCVILSKNAAVAIVSDGCSAEKSSEVGAFLGSRLICNALTDFLNQMGEYEGINLEQEIEKILERVRLDVLAQIRVLVNSMPGNLNQNIEGGFLFTAIGCLVSRYYSAFFSIGDGLIIVNDETLELGPFPGNAPPYFCYPIVDPEKLPEGCAGQCKFRIKKIVETKKVKSVILGTDGLKDVKLAEGKKIPGVDDTVEPLSQFVENDRYFSNPQAIQRRLTMMSRNTQHIDWERGKIAKENGLLPDDTTLVAIRRKKKGGG